MKKLISVLFLLMISLAGASISATSASACTAGGGSAIGCGIQCMNEHPFALQALCDLISPAPQPAPQASDHAASLNIKAD